MALKADSIAAIKATRLQLKTQIQALQQNKQDHQAAITAINDQLAILQAQRAALTADLPEVTD